MLWLQMATHMGIALLSLAARMQTYGNPYPTQTIGLFIDAVVPHLRLIATDVVCLLT